jgi:hypothetical protein
LVSVAFYADLVKLVSHELFIEQGGLLGPGLTLVGGNALNDDQSLI